VERGEEAEVIFNFIPSLQIQILAKQNLILHSHIASQVLV